jgi:hypothetical protein
MKCSNIRPCSLHQPLREASEHAQSSKKNPAIRGGVGKCMRAAALPPALSVYLIHSAGQASDGPALLALRYRK